MKKDPSILDDMEEEILVIDKELKILYANETFIIRSGKGKEDILGRSCFEVTHSSPNPCPPQDHPCPAKNVFESGRSFKTTHVHKDIDGKSMHVEILASPIKEKGKIVSAIEVMRDITELVSTQKRISEFIDTTPDGIFTTTPDGRLVFANPALAKMQGYAGVEEILGKPIAKTFWAHPEQRKEYLQELEKKGIVKDKEIVLKKADGTEFYGSISSVVKRNDSGKIRKIEGIVRDVTKRKIAEEELLKRNRELRIINAIASIINKSNRLEEMLEECIKELLGFFDMEACAIFLDEEKKKPKASYGLPLSLQDEKNARFEEFLNDPSFKRSFFIKDLHSQEIPRKEILEREGFLSLLSAPLETDSKRLGFVLLFSKKSFEMEDVQIQFFSSILRYIGTGIQKISYTEKIKIMSERLEKIVEEKTKKTKALLESYYALQHTASWEIGLKTIVESVTDSLGFENTYIYLLNEKRNAMTCEAFKSSYDDLPSKEIPLNDEDYIAVQCIRTKKPINIKDAFSDPRVKKQLGYKIKEFAWVPIVFQNEILGAFSVDNKDSGKSITEEDIETLVLFANMAASFIEKTRLFFLPTPERLLSGKTKYKLAPSEGYIVFEEKPEKGFEIFTDAVNHGIQGLCASRIYPSKLRQRFSLAKTPILWLSSVQASESINPTDLGKLVHVITEFLQRAEESLIFLEGIEYLITENDFLKVMKALHSLMDTINITGSRLLLSVNSKTLSEKELGIMRKEFLSI